MRLSVKRTGVSVALSIRLEPCLWVEGLGLLMLSVPTWVSLSIPAWNNVTDLSHVLEKFLSTPSI